MKDYGVLVINNFTNSKIYVSILYVYLRSTTREADSECLSDVRHPYLSPAPWVFSQNVMNEKDKKERPQVFLRKPQLSR